MGFWKNVGKIFGGKKGKHRQLSTLTPEQQKIQAQLESQAGGAITGATDYWKSILSDDPETMAQLSAPELRKFNEEIIPGLSEQFAGMGAGGLSSSGFRNAAVSAGTDLSERLGAMRAKLRNEAAQNLMNVGTQALKPTTENIYQPGTPGLIDYASQTAGNLLGQYGIDKAQNWLGLSTKGKSSPYGTGSLNDQAQNIRNTSQSAMRYR